MITKGQLVIHKLKGVHIYNLGGNKCSVCGHIRNKPLTLNIFQPGTPVMAKTMNDNFDLLANEIANLNDKIRELETKIK